MMLPGIIDTRARHRARARTLRLLHLRRRWRTPWHHGHFNSTVPRLFNGQQQHGQLDDQYYKLTVWSEPYLQLLVVDSLQLDRSRVLVAWGLFESSYCTAHVWSQLPQFHQIKVSLRICWYNDDNGLVLYRDASVVEEYGQINSSAWNAHVKQMFFRVQIGWAARCRAPSAFCCRFASEIVSIYVVLMSWGIVSAQHILC